MNQLRHSSGTASGMNQLCHSVASAFIVFEYLPERTPHVFFRQHHMLTVQLAAAAGCRLLGSHVQNLRAARRPSQGVLSIESAAAARVQPAHITFAWCTPVEKVLRS